MEPALDEIPELFAGAARQQEPSPAVEAAVSKAVAFCLALAEPTPPAPDTLEAVTLMMGSPSAMCFFMRTEMHHTMLTIAGGNTHLRGDTNKKTCHIDADLVCSLLQHNSTAHDTLQQNN